MPSTRRFIRNPRSLQIEIHFIREVALMCNIAATTHMSNICQHKSFCPIRDYTNWNVFIMNRTGGGGWNENGTFPRFLHLFKVQKKVNFDKNCLKWGITEHPQLQHPRIFRLLPSLFFVLLCTHSQLFKFWMSVHECSHHSCQIWRSRVIQW